MQKCEHEHYSCIFRVSFLSFLSSIYALYCGVYDLAIVPGGVFLTSVNYWRYPIHGWRRNLDMGYVASALIYQNYRAYYMATEGHEYILLYYALMFFSIGCYPVSLHLHKKRTYGVQLMSIVCYTSWRILQIWFYTVVAVAVASGTGTHQAGALRRFVQLAMRRFSGDI